MFTKSFALFKLFIKSTILSFGVKEFIFSKDLILLSIILFSESVNFNNLSKVSTILVVSIALFNSLSFESKFCNSWFVDCIVTTSLLKLFDTALTVCCVEFIKLLLASTVVCKLLIWSVTLGKSFLTLER